MKVYPIIRTLEKEDIPQLVELCKEHAHFEKVTFSNEGKGALLFQHFFPVNDEIRCFVLTNERELLGYSTILRQFSTWDAGFYFYMDCLYLKKEIRGLGYGSAMMDALRKFVEQRKSYLQWQTPDFNHNAIRFYEAIGAQHQSKERFYWHLK